MTNSPGPEETQRKPAQTVIRSPVLYHGFVRVAERTHPGRARLLSGTRLKALAFPLLHRLIRYTPVPLALVVPRFVVWILRLFYFWPGNRLRHACTAIDRLSRTAGQAPAPRTIYRDYLKNALGAIENFFLLYRHSADRVLPRIRMADADTVRLQHLIETHGGIILAVPHNLGSAFSALRIGASFDMLLVAKNSPTVERTRIAIDFYERMNLSLLMVRGGNVFELSRTLFTALKQRKLIAATLDNIDRTDHRESITFFGRQVGLSSWAAKIAVKMQVPIVPAYFSSRGKIIDVHVGDALVTRDVHQAVSHYARFFETEILRDPASWAYLADKHWQKILAAAVKPG